MKIIKKIVLLFSFIFLFLLFGCNSFEDITQEKTPIITETDETPEISDDPIINETPEISDDPTINETPEISDDPTINETPEISDDPTINETPNIDGIQNVSFQWQDYVGDIETFVYGLIVNELQCSYDLFTAYAYTHLGNEYYGIGFTDYDDVFIEDNGKHYFTSGMIYFPGEEHITKEEIEFGVEVENLDMDFPEYSFVLTYELEPQKKHCVAFGKYITYGIDENGVIVYTYDDFEKEECDISLGELYSYDEQRYLYDPYLGEYEAITGSTLAQTLDYDELEKKVNKILEEQNQNFVNYDIQSVAYMAQEAIQNYLLSMQEEMFCGFRVQDLIDAANQLDPMTCFRFTTEGLAVIEVSPTPPPTPTEFTKWLVGVGCGIVFVGSIVLEIFIPVLKPITGALSGVAMDVFCQVLIENKMFSNIHWGKVAISAVVGAVCSIVGPHVGSAVSKGVGSAFGSATKLSSEIGIMLASAAGKLAATITNSLLIGMTAGIFTLMDGGTWGEAGKTFVITFGMSVALGVAFELIGAGVSKVVSKLGSWFSKKLPNAFMQKVRNLAAGVKAFINKHQVEAGKWDDIILAKSTYSSASEAFYTARRNAYEKELLHKKITQLVSPNNKNFQLVDEDNNPITKQELELNGGNGKIILKDTADDTVKLALKDVNGNLITEIPIKNGDPDLSLLSKSTIKLNTQLTGERYKHNFPMLDEELADFYTMNPELIPDDIYDELLKIGVNPEIDVVLGKNITDIRKNLHLTWHEGADGFTGYLIDTTIHSKVSHYGGVGVAKLQIKYKIGTWYFDNLIPEV